MPLWFILSLCAAISWGIQYSSYGAKLTHVNALSYLWAYYLGVALSFTVYAVCTTRSLPVPQMSSVDWKWFLVNVLFGAAGSILVTLSIQEKNATLASLVEISYPLFVVLFGVLFFQEKLPSLQAVFGGVLILTGVTVLFTAK